MGCVTSKPPVLEHAEGDEAAYLERYLEDRVLGEGEFGVVHLVYDVKARAASSSPGEPYAAKTLRKGITFKDNTIFTPLKPEALRRECLILRRLRGEHHVLKLVGIYESASTIRIVTEYCSGGDMMEYVINAYGQDRASGLRTEDVSRISYQLLDAVDHCARNGVIHRDIKPENIMFRTSDRGAELRLIDFGSSSLDGDDESPGGGGGGSSKKVASSDGGNGSHDELRDHTTFAGSAFYIAPEVFQRKYDSKADVWSAGVTLYVLVAGYPSEHLQKAFNLLQKAKRDLRKMPNMPPNMPDTFYEMLDELLVYRRNKRKSAGDVLGCDFVRFHVDHLAEDGATVDGGRDKVGAGKGGGGAESGKWTKGDGKAGRAGQSGGSDDEGDEDGMVGMSLDDVANFANGAGDDDVDFQEGQSVRGRGGGMRGRTMSVLLEGSVQRHTLYAQYEKFERSVTTLIATVLNQDQLTRLLCVLSGQTLEVNNNNTKAGGKGKAEDATKSGEKDDKEEKALDRRTRPAQLTPSATATTTPTASAADLGKSSQHVGEEVVEVISNERKLQIIKICELKAVLKEMEFKEAMTMMSDLPNASSYENFAYHIGLLRQFSRIQEGRSNDLDSSAHRNFARRLSGLSNRGGGGLVGSMSQSASAGGGTAMKKTLSGSNLAQSGSSGGGGGGGGGGAKRNAPNSVHGSNVFKDFRKKRDQRNALLAANGGVARET